MTSFPAFFRSSGRSACAASFTLMVTGKVAACLTRKVWLTDGRVRGTLIEWIVQIGEVRNGCGHIDAKLLGPLRYYQARWPATVGKRAISREEALHNLNRANRSGQADALSRSLQHLVESFKADGQVGAALATGHHMNLIQDHSGDPPQPFTSRRCQHEEERFRGCDQDVGWASGEGAAFVGRRIACADSDANVRRGQAQLLGCSRDPNQGRSKVPLDVRGKSFER